MSGIEIASMKLSEVKTLVQQTTGLDDLIQLSLSLQKDSRASVIKLQDTIEKKIQKINELRWKFCEMQQYEKRLKINGCHVIAGIDEAGRGPLAGPVVAAAVVLGDQFDVFGIDDSKKLSATQREDLFEKIVHRSEAHGIGIASVEEIDTLNILNATKLAMKRAVENLGVVPEHLLIDAVKLDQVSVDQTPLIKGDQKSLSIAAASILAKVTRDRMVDAMAATYPEYGLAQHKGYGTKAHCEAILKYGPAEIHRKTFIKNLMAGESDEDHK